MEINRTSWQGVNVHHFNNRAVTASQKNIDITTLTEISTYNKRQMHVE